MTETGCEFALQVVERLSVENFSTLKRLYNYDSVSAPLLFDDVRALFESLDCIVDEDRENRVWHFAISFSQKTPRVVSCDLKDYVANKEFIQELCYTLRLFGIKQECLS